ncbi:MAG TPA: VWA domain-containing protein [Terriglobia bacterium]|nr:VWA domain-containing protein [Terriglobia bacterium]
MRKHSDSMPGLKRILSGILFSLLAPCYAWSQTASSIPQTRPQNHQTGNTNLPAIQIQSPLVVAPVTVIDASGNLVENLKMSDFSVLDDGVPQSITRCELTMEPVAAVIVLQANDSVAPLLDEVHPLGPLFSDLLLGGPGQAAVVTYADKVQVVQSFSSDPATLATTLRRISANGGKARLNDALERTVSMLAGRKRPERRVIIVISEGFDRGSATSAAEIVRAASESNVEIYGLRFNLAETTFKQDETSGMFDHTLSTCPPGPPGTPVIACGFRLNLMPFAILALQTGAKEMRANVLQQYAGYTGGVVYTHAKKRSLQNQLQNIALDINSQYILTYVPSTPKEVGFHPIQIEVSRPDLEVRTRAGYFYGAAANYTERH